jgi:hypothetical protein
MLIQRIGAFSRCNILALLLEQGEVDGVGHRLVPGIVGMEVIA